MTSTISIDEFIRFIRHQMSVSDCIPITENSMLESDLGITGDDGVDLINAIEKAFNIALSDPEKGLRKGFNLKANECLFHGEGFDIFGWTKGSVVKPISVGDLHQAIVKLQHN